ncbi:hypothetical protein IQ274_15785 [Nostoc sp. LEGE 12447]|uniref:hypothetical protein n=1 Tax=Nostoc sp. LEGE 12447 TaxID=1828640 RepID=UPI001884875C|nr:hypothetical protein [Nostoc sp. LEGE 12447]MBE8999653.1 hypothetical protein [Nostoc sp. LEGE 12447]
MEISPLGSNHSLPVFQQDYFNGSQRSPSEAESSTLALESLHHNAMKVLGGTPLTKESVVIFRRRSSLEVSVENLVF